MKQDISMKNKEISALNINLMQLMQENLALPIKVSFFLEKNNKIISNLAMEIEDKRQEICQKYGTLNEEQNIYIFDDITEAEKELNDLFDIEQEFMINMVDIEDFGDINLTSQQMKAISFMIREDD